ncbi:complement C1q-like protein 2 [Glandiceps talaboti]
MPMACLAFLATILQPSSSAEILSALGKGKKAAAKAAQQEKKAAFSVGRDTSFGPFDVDTIVPFEVEFANSGGSFDITTGIFTVPVKGYYLLLQHVFKDDSNPGGPITILKVNDRVILRADECCSNDQMDSASNSVIIPLEAGDEVYLLLAAGRIVSAAGHRETSFSGTFLFD